MVFSMFAYDHSALTTKMTRLKMTLFYNPANMCRGFASKCLVSQKA